MHTASDLSITCSFGAKMKTNIMDRQIKRKTEIMKEKISDFLI